MNAFLAWLVQCLFLHYWHGYKHGHERAMADVAQANRETQASIARKQAEMQVILENTEAVMADMLAKLADGAA